MAARVRDIMDPDPVTVREDERIERVLHLLRDEELPGLPVVDGDGRCVGIITERDLVLADEEGELHLPHYISVFGGLVFLQPLQRFEARLRKAFAATARDMMTPRPLSVSPDVSVGEAARVISETGHNRLPVVLEGDHLVGVVTRVDVLEALVRRA